MTTFYLEVGDGSGDVLGVTSSVTLAYRTGSQEGGDTTLVTITPTLESTGFDLPPDIAIYYRSKLVGGSFGDWQTDNTFTLADGEYEVEAQLRYTSTGNPVVQKLDVDGETLVDVTAVSTTFTVGASSTAGWDENADGEYYSSSFELSNTFPDLSNSEGLSTVEASTSYEDIQEIRVLADGLVLRVEPGNWPDPLPPYLAVWTTWVNDSSPSWRTFEWNGQGSFNNRYTLQTDNLGNNGDWSEPGVEFAVVFQTQSGLPTTWADYS